MRHADDHAFTAAVRDDEHADQLRLQIFSLVGVAGVFEFVGGVLLLLGLFTHPVAFIVSGEMAFAYFLGHAPNGFFFSPMMNEGLPAVLYCFIFLYLAAAGSGPWSVDAVRAAKPG